MFTRKSRKLLGAVKKIEVEFAVFEMIDGKLKETRHQSAGYSIYDLEGKLIEEVSPYRWMMYDAYKDIYFYDENGELDYREEYDENNSLVGKSVFQKTENGSFIVENYYFDVEGKLKLGSHYIYEDENNGDDSLIEIAHYDENEKISPKSFYRKDSTEENEEVLVQKSVSKDGNGYTIEEIRNYKSEKLIEKVVTSYDVQGNIKEFSCYKQDGTLTLKDVYEYKFDSFGNWTEQIQNHWVIGWGKFKLVPLTISRRNIEYFNE